MNNRKKIVLITTGQPSCNPRIVKEANAFFDAGYNVTLLYCYFIDWAQEKDIDLLKSVSWGYKQVGGCPTNNKFQYNYSRAKFKIARVLNKYFGNAFKFAERAQARAYDALLNEAKKNQADWYIGHNLGALAVAVVAAKYNKAKAGFDFEDYHRAEVDNMTKSELDRIIFLEKKYLPSLSYISAASDLILDAVKLNHTTLNYKSNVIYNCFPKRVLNNLNLAKQPKQKDILNLFWFSQTIGLGRGLELVLEALEIINDKNIHLTLAGRCDECFKIFLENISDSVKANIHFAGIIAPNNLVDFSSNFDVGLALELDIPLNRNICLTNKIFTYLLAGSAIIISETTAQKTFNDSYKVGKVYRQNNVAELVDCVQFYRTFEILQKQKLHNVLLAESVFNWEVESKKLLQLIS